MAEEITNTENVEQTETTAQASTEVQSVETPKENENLLSMTPAELEAKIAEAKADATKEAKMTKEQKEQAKADREREALVKQLNDLKTENLNTKISSKIAASGLDTKYQSLIRADLDTKDEDIDAQIQLLVDLRGNTAKETEDSVRKQVLKNNDVPKSSSVDEKENAKATFRPAFGGNWIQNARDAGYK